jgi:hypothetical protein
MAISKIKLIPNSHVYILSMKSHVIKLFKDNTGQFVYEYV